MYIYQVLRIGEKFKTTELIPDNGRKSFYGKALIHETARGVFLQSYETIVAMIDKQGNFHKLWGGYSDTTSKHVSAFMRLYGLPGIGKKDWLKLPLLEKLPQRPYEKII